MSETDTAPATPAEAPAPPAAPTPAAPAAAPAPKDESKPPWGDDFDPARAWNTIQTLRAREKELAPLAEKAKQLEDAQKTETERLTERATTAEQRAQEAELRILRRDVADAKGLTAAQAKYLTGSTQEEIEAAAEQILADFPVAAPAAPSRKPRERLRGGGDPEVEPVETDPNKLAEMVPRNKF